jgi:hypothetical protein
LHGEPQKRHGGEIGSPSPAHWQSPGPPSAPVGHPRGTSAHLGDLLQRGRHADLLARGAHSAGGDGGADGLHFGCGGVLGCWRGLRGDRARARARDHTPEQPIGKPTHAWANPENRGFGAPAALPGRRHAHRDALGALVTVPGRLPAHLAGCQPPRTCAATRVRQRGGSGEWEVMEGAEGRAGWGGCLVWQRTASGCR